MSNRPPVNTDGRILSYNPVNGISGVMPEISYTFVKQTNFLILPNFFFRAVGYIFYVHTKLQRFHYIGNQLVRRVSDAER